MYILNICNVSIFIGFIMVKQKTQSLNYNSYKLNKCAATHAKNIFNFQWDQN